MINRRSTFFLGIFIFLIPFLGLPSSWKTALVVICGLSLIGLSIKITLPKRAVPSKNRVRKEKVTPIFVESIPTYQSENTKTEENQPDIELK